MEELEMTEHHQTEAPKKKLSLQEAAKQMLENKKKQSQGSNGKMNADLSTKKMKNQNQQTKKASTTRRKMGS